MAPPTSRVVSFMADATPALFWGSDDTIASVAAGNASAMPAAMTMIAPPIGK